MAEVRINLPDLGLSDEQSFTDQPPRTTRDARDVRFRDPVTNRKRLTQRPGLSKFSPSAVGTGGKVQHLATAVDSGSVVTLVEAVNTAGIVELWRKDLPGKSTCRCAHYDPVLGILYVVDGTSAVSALNEDGFRLGGFGVGLAAEAKTEVIKVLTDSLGRVYVIDAPKITYNHTMTPVGVQVESFTDVGIAGGTRVRMYGQTGANAGESYELLWEDGITSQIHVDMCISGTSLFTLVADGNPLSVGMRVNKYSIGGVEPKLEGTGLVRAGTSWWGKIAADEAGNVYVAEYMNEVQLEDWDVTIDFRNDPVNPYSNLWRFDASLPTGDDWVIPGGTTAFSTPLLFGNALTYNEATGLLYSYGMIYDTFSAPESGRCVVAIEPQSGEVVWVNWVGKNDTGAALEESAIIDPYCTMFVDDTGNVFIPSGVYDFELAGYGVALVSGGEDSSGFEDVDYIYYLPTESAGGDDTQAFYSVGAGPSKVIGNPNLIQRAAREDFSVWNKVGAGVTVSINTDAGPFLNGKADQITPVLTTDGVSLSGGFGPDSFPDGSDSFVTSPCFSVYLKSDGADETKLDLELNGSVNFYVAVIDWTTSPPSITLDTVETNGQVGVSGPVNGYYRFWVCAGAEADDVLVAILPDTSAGVSGVFAAGAKLEESPSGTPTALNPIWGHERLFVGGGGQGLVTPVASGELYAPARAIRILDTQASGDASTRRRVNIAVSSGDLWLFNSSESPLAIAGAQASTSGGTQGLEPNAYFIDSTYAFGHLVLADGRRMLAYNVSTGDVDELKSKSAGATPRFASLCATWQGRLFLAGFADNPDDWLASARGDIFDYDTSPATASVAAAINGTTAEYGSGITDVITSLVPQTDDRMLIGCDHTLLELLGDPGDRGQLDVVSAKVGMAFGRAWAQDPAGNTFFLSNEGRLYVRPAGGGGIQPVTTYTIDKRLEDIDLSTYRVEMQWSNQEQGLYIFQVQPGFTSGSAAVASWFFEAKHSGFWEDKITTAARQPTATLALDGDAPGDRVLLIGCNDGNIRQIDMDADDDDGVAIAAHCLVGPYHFDGDAEMRLQHVRSKLDPAYSGLNLEVYAEDEPQELTVPAFTTFLPAGSTENIRFRARGSYVYMRLSNAANNQRFSVESLYMGASKGSRRRVIG